MSSSQVRAGTTQAALHASSLSPRGTRTCSTSTGSYQFRREGECLLISQEGISFGDADHMEVTNCVLLLRVFKQTKRRQQSLMICCSRSGNRVHLPLLPWVLNLSRCYTSPCPSYVR